MPDARIEVDYAIVGGGVLGLALAEAISRRVPTALVVLFERHSKFGQEASSHNSEVIHAGIYYEKTPLKGTYCRRGRDLLYAFCKQHDVGFRNCGKYIVATDEAQLPALERLGAHATQHDVPIADVPAATLRHAVQNPQAIAGLWSPTTGIVDSHALMQRLAARAQDRGVIFNYATAFVGLEKVDGSGTTFDVRDGNGETFGVRARCFLNAAGLGATALASRFAPDGGFATRPCRGRYFALARRFTHRYAALLYPLPDPAGGLGVHLTLDMSGRCRLGPDVDWSQQGATPDDPALYQFDLDTVALQERFWRAGQRLLPDLQPDDLCPDYVGVRAKLFIDGVAHPDFHIVRSHADSAWHFLGIESPGLTAALAIAEAVAADVA